VARSDDIVDAVMWLLRAGFTSGETVHLEGGARYETALRRAPAAALRAAVRAGR